MSLKINLPDKKPQPQQKSQQSRGELWGTGFQKRDAERAERASEKVQQQESEIAVIPNAEELHNIMQLELPSTLVADDLQLDPSQQAAVDGLLHQKYGCLIGAAGTGKTTTIKALVHNILQHVKNPHIAFGSFTGRAVQQIKRALPAEYHSHCDTIHGLLEYAPEPVEKEDENGNMYVTKIFVPHRTEMNPLDQNIIIIDEGGMVPIDLWNNLLAACRPNTRIYLIGDINQLPPVQGRSVLGFAMQAWPTYELDRIHRTDEDAITGGAWDIIHGKMPKAAEGKIVLKQIDTNSLTAFQQTCAVIQRLHKNGAFHPLRDGLIVPQNKDNLGQEHLNERLCPYFNPPQKQEGITINPRTIVTAGYNHLPFAVGDKVMVTQNDREQGLTNGMIGVIESIKPNERFKGEVVGDMAAATLSNTEINFDELDSALDETQKDDDALDERERQASHVMRVHFQNHNEPIEFSTAGAINTLKHAYAFTCHKAQGGEYPTVAIVVHSANIRMLSREWLYTAWTRAQEKIVLLYNTRGIAQALSRQMIKGKTIAEKAQAFLQLQERQANGDEVKTPTLPAPERVEYDK